VESAVVFLRIFKETDNNMNHRGAQFNPKLIVFKSEIFR